MIGLVDKAIEILALRGDVRESTQHVGAGIVGIQQPRTGAHPFALTGRHVYAVHLAGTLNSVACDPRRWTQFGRHGIAVDVVEPRRRGLSDEFTDGCVRPETIDVQGCGVDQRDVTVGSHEHHPVVE